DTTELVTNTMRSEGQSLHVTTPGFFLHASDLLLDGRSRLLASHSPYYRALVDGGNKLIVNYNGDYQDGVEIHGNLTVAGAGAIKLKSVVLDVENSGLGSIAGTSFTTTFFAVFAQRVRFNDGPVEISQNLNVGGEVFAGNYRTPGGDCAEQFDIA